MTRLPRVSDEVAYCLPMAVFLAGLWVGGRWPAAYVPAYGARVAAVAVALFLLRSHYTKVRWNHAALGLLVGVIGVFQWVGMQAWLEHLSPFFRANPDRVFDPTQHFTTPAGYWSFTALRMTGAVLVVPVMEELFWRDWMWRTILAPNDFKLASVGEFAWAPVLIVTGIFTTVHANWGLTAAVWGGMIAALLVYTRSLGACIIAHATTNLLLGLWVLHSHNWSLW